MIHKRVPLLVCVISILLAMSPSGLYSQMAGTGHIDGNVTDQTGAAVAGATVTLTDAATNTARTATTNEAGRYDFFQYSSRNLYSNDQQSRIPIDQQLAGSQRGHHKNPQHNPANRFISRND